MYNCIKKYIKQYSGYSDIMKQIKTINENLKQYPDKGLVKTLPE
jgi:hypothetical protein